MSTNDAVTKNLLERIVKAKETVERKNGGLILGPGSAMDYAKPENVRAMIETVKKYGQY